MALKTLMINYPSAVAVHFDLLETLPHSEYYMLHSVFGFSFSYICNVFTNIHDFKLIGMLDGQSGYIMHLLERMPDQGDWEFSQAQAKQAML